MPRAGTSDGIGATDAGHVSRSKPDIARPKPCRPVSEVSRMIGTVCAGLTANNGSADIGHTINGDLAMAVMARLDMAEAAGSIAVAGTVGAVDQGNSVLLSMQDTAEVRSSD